MTLLAPIPALFAAALAVPALLFFYFLKLKRRPIRVSSTMLFEDAAHDLQVNVPLKWLTPSWLLLLQLIALACLLLAFARPAINLDAPPAERLVILIDRSASMNALNPIDPARTTRLDRAKTRAHELVKRGSSTGSRIMIVTFAGSAQAVSAFSSNATQLHAAIDAIEPTDGASNIAAALQLIEAINAGIGGGEGGDENTPEGPSENADAGDNGASLDVALLSDGAFNETEPLNLPGARVTFESMVRLEAPIDPGKEARSADTDNIAIDALSAARDPNNPASARAFIRLYNTKPSPDNTPTPAPTPVTLTLALDGEVFRRTVVHVPPMQSDGEPGEAALTESFDAPTGTLLTATIDVNDALSADNAAAVVLPPATRPRVLLVEPGGPTAQTGGASGSFLIEDVLNELALSEVRRVTADQAEEMRRNNQLAAFSLIIYDRVAPAQLPPVASLSFGASLPIDGLDQSRVEQATHVLSWRRTDTLLRDVSLDGVVIAETIALSLDRVDGATTLARGSDGPLIVRIDDNGIERIIVAFDLVQSTWPLSPSFAIFLSNAVDTLVTGGGGGGGGGSTSFTTAQPATIRVPVGWRTIRVAGPQSIQIDRETQAFARTSVPLGVLEKAGVYTVQIDGQPASPIAINLASRTESVLTDTSVVTIGGETLASTTSSDAPREIWHWFIIAALIALAIEWLVNAMMMRV